MNIQLKPLSLPPDDLQPAWDGIRTIKRYRMQSSTCFSGFALNSIQLTSWHENQQKDHALVLFQAFESSPDQVLFPGLSTYSGCEVIMDAIAGASGFIPSATLLAKTSDGEPVGSIQAMVQNQAGLILNVGVSPKQRGRGLGKSLLIGCLSSLRAEGFPTVCLEVTASNSKALSLYGSLGFHRTRVQYLPLPSPQSDAHGFWGFPDCFQA